MESKIEESRRDGLVSLNKNFQTSKMLILIEVKEDCDFLFIYLLDYQHYVDAKWPRRSLQLEPMICFE